MSTEKIVLNPWTSKYQITIRVLYRMIQDPNHRVKRAEVNPNLIGRWYNEELISLGVLTIEDKYFKLNLDELKKYSIVVDDGFFENLTDINWMRDQRKRLGLIEGRVKGQDFRERQNRRRRERKEFRDQQAAKYQNQPQDELPLSEIVFEDSSCSETFESK